jgi:hypothetical protein
MFKYVYSISNVIVFVEFYNCVNFYASSKITYGNVSHSVRLEIGLLMGMIRKNTVL